MRRWYRVVVLSFASTLGSASAMVDALVAAGTIDRGNGNSLTKKLENAAKSIGKENLNAVERQLGAFLNELRAMAQSGRLTNAEAEPFRVLVERVATAISAE